MAPADGSSRAVRSGHCEECKECGFAAATAADSNEAKIVKMFADYEWAPSAHSRLDFREDPLAWHQLVCAEPDPWPTRRLVSDYGYLLAQK